ncbi:MAG: FkbM family methyltransferase, partial [Verrucomicrobiota bacterium]
TIIPTFAERCSESKKIEMQARTLDEMVEELPPPDVMKVDVEGAEHPVLEGGKKFLTQHHPPIIIEFNRESIHDSGKTPSSYLDLFLDLGYDIFKPYRPWVGYHRWEGKTRINHEGALPALCNIVLLKSD